MIHKRASSTFKRTPTTENIFIPLFLALSIVIILLLTNGAIREITLKSIFTEKKLSLRIPQSGLKVAVCLTGQVARLELLSKIHNCFLPNAKLGHLLHLFMLLDNSDEIKQTFWKYNYDSSPYINYDINDLLTLINSEMLVKKNDIEHLFIPRIRLESPGQDIFEVMNNFIPVTDKVNILCSLKL